MKILRPLTLSIHSISLRKFRFESRVSFNSYRARFKVQAVQGSPLIMKTSNILTTTIAFE